MFNHYQLEAIRQFEAEQEALRNECSTLYVEVTRGADSISHTLNSTPFTPPYLLLKEVK